MIRHLYDYKETVHELAVIILSFSTFFIVLAIIVLFFIGMLLIRKFVLKKYVSKKITSTFEFKILFILSLPLIGIISLLLLVYALDSYVRRAFYVYIDSKIENFDIYEFSNDIVKNSCS